MTGNAISAKDDDTLGYYAENAAKYAADSLKLPPSPKLDYFAAQLPPHPKVLELGCGAGRDTADMIKRGFDVHPTDGSPQMAQRRSSNHPGGLIPRARLPRQAVTRRTASTRPPSRRGSSLAARNRGSRRPR